MLGTNESHLVHAADISSFGEKEAAAGKRRSAPTAVDPFLTDSRLY